MSSVEPPFTPADQPSAPEMRLVSVIILAKGIDLDRLQATPISSFSSLAAPYLRHF
jgi:hypothetical protein